MDSPLTEFPVLDAPHKDGRSPMSQADLVTSCALHQEQAEDMLFGCLLQVDEDAARQVIRERGLLPEMLRDASHAEALHCFLNGEDMAGVLLKLKAYRPTAMTSQAVIPGDYPHFVDEIIKDYTSRQLAAKVQNQAQALANGDADGFWQHYDEIGRLRQGGGQTKAERIIVRSMADSLKPHPPRDWVIQDLLAAGHVGMFSGFTGKGKTWLMYELCVCVALGVPWMGFETVQGPVLIINEEMDQDDLDERLGMCNRAHFGSETTPVYSISFARFNLFSDRNADHDEALIEQAIVEKGARFVLVDALADIMAGGDENSVRDTQEVMMRLSAIAKRTRSTIMVIHHTGWNEERARGSTAIPGAVDLALLMKRSNDSSYVTITTEKARIIPHNEWTGIMAWVGKEQFYSERVEDGEKAKDKPTDKQQAVITFLQGCDQQQASTKDIVRETGCTRQTIYNYEKDGLIRRVTTDPGRETIWEVNQPV